jgi:hypothetical protein
MNVSMEIIYSMVKALDMPDNYFHTKCQNCECHIWFNLIDVVGSCKVLPEYGGCKSSVDLTPLRETKEFQLMVESRIKQWIEIKKRRDSMIRFREPPTPFDSKDFRLVRYIDGNFACFHKDDKIFDGFGINQQLTRNVLKEIV